MHNQLLPAQRGKRPRPRLKPTKALVDLCPPTASSRSARPPASAAVQVSRQNHPGSLHQSRATQVRPACRTPAKRSPAQAPQTAVATSSPPRSARNAAAASHRYPAPHPSASWSRQFLHPHSQSPTGSVPHPATVAAGNHAHSRSPAEAGQASTAAECARKPPQQCSQEPPREAPRAAPRSASASPAAAPQSPAQPQQPLPVSRPQFPHAPQVCPAATQPAQPHAPPPQAPAAWAPHTPACRKTPAAAASGSTYHSPFLISFLIRRIVRSFFSRDSRSMNSTPSRWSISCCIARDSRSSPSTSNQSPCTSCARTVTVA